MMIAKCLLVDWARSMTMILVISDSRNPEMMTITILARAQQTETPISIYLALFDTEMQSHNSQAVESISDWWYDRRKQISN